MTTCVRLCHMNLSRGQIHEARQNECFFVFAFYVDAATLRHVHIQGRNTTKKPTTCNLWYCHSQSL